MEADDTNEATAANIIERISNIVRGIWKHKEDPESLSKDLNDLAVLNWALSAWQATFEEEERILKTALELEKATLLEEYTSDGTAVNKAEVKVTIETNKMRQEHNKLASGLEKVKITIRANQSVMDAARSRLSLIKGELK